MSVIRWLVMQEVYRRFEFARHFESYLARPPPFYMRMRTTTSDEHFILTMLRSTRIIFSIYLFIKFGGLLEKGENRNSRIIIWRLPDPQDYMICHISTRKIIGGFKFGGVLVKSSIRQI